MDYPVWIMIAAGITAVLLLMGLFLIVKLLIRKAADRRRSRDLVFLEILIPKKDGKEDKDSEGSEFGNSKDFTKFAGIMTQLFASLHAMRRNFLWNKWFVGDDFFTCEYSVIDGQIYWHLGIPSSTQRLVEKQITSFYADAVVNQTGVPNIFVPNAKIRADYFQLGKRYAMPLRTTEKMETDPLNNITNALSKIPIGEGAAIQIMCRPLANTWQDGVNQIAEDIYGQKKKKSIWRYINPLWWLWHMFEILFQGESAINNDSSQQPSGGVTPMMQERVKAIEEKAGCQGFDVIVRTIASAKTRSEAEAHGFNTRGSFDQFNTPDMNAWTRLLYPPQKTILRDYILRRWHRPLWQTLWRLIKIGEWRQILATTELSTLYHFPNADFNKSPAIKWQDFKIVGPPHNVPDTGLLLGINKFRGVDTEIRIKPGDRMRHFYLIGKSGTGKSTILEQMIRQDLANGHGLCLVDPHGDLVESVLPYVPRERADDVILFDPGDIDRPMGLNMLEAKTEDQKEFVAQEALAIFIKMYGEEIMGPRLQHYFRNGVLTLMADDDEGATLLDIMRLFTDDAYAKIKTPKVTNPSVRSFWDREMAKTGQREKEEMIPYFAAKFGPFVTNAQVRNIIGQTKSGFDFRDVMDNKKILLCNLSKGKLGDLNAKLLGMIMVSKIQMAAMSRVDTPEEDRADFYLYVDEFQNFVTDSFASILSEARKYRLGLIVAHQYISQITKMDGGGKGSHEDTTIRDAVFGNVGSMMCFKIGAQDAETMAKEFQPVFSEQDLINIANYQAYIKLNINNATSRGFSMNTIYDPSGADADGAEAFRQLSRLKFGRDREFVTREIARRLM